VIQAYNVLISFGQGWEPTKNCWNCVGRHRTCDTTNGMWLKQPIEQWSWQISTDTNGEWLNVLPGGSNEWSLHVTFIVVCCQPHLPFRFTNCNRTSAKHDTVLTQAASYSKVLKIKFTSKYFQ